MQQPKRETEKALIRCAKAGDMDAFSALISAYDRHIYNIGLRLLGNQEDAADLTQETLLKIYRGLPTFRGGSAFSTWVYRVCVNTCRDMLRSACRRKEIAFSDFCTEDEDASLEVADFSALPEDLCLASEQGQYLRALIDGLTPSFRLTLSLRELSGLSYQEIAEACGVSVGTVKSRLNRARAALRAQAEQDQYAFFGRKDSKGGDNNGMC